MYKVSYAMGVGSVFKLFKTSAAAEKFKQTIGDRFISMRFI